MTETPTPPVLLPFNHAPYLDVESLEDPLHPSAQLWTKGELISWLQAPPEFISSEIRTGRLKALFLSSGRVRFLWTDIVNWLEARTRATRERQGATVSE